MLHVNTNANFHIRTVCMYFHMYETVDLVNICIHNEHCVHVKFMQKT